MSKKTLVTSLFGIACSLPIIAGSMGDIKQSTPSPMFYVGAFGGYGTVDGAYGQDGNVSQGRLTLGLHAKNFDKLSLGAELGVQSGNTMRLNAGPDVIEVSGGLPIQSTLKPIVDALITAQYQFYTTRPLFAILKGGIAYRQLQLDNRSSAQDNLNKVNGEFQAGLGFGVTQNVRITALYQGIYSTNNSGIGLNSVGDITLSQIPTQQAGLLGVEYYF